MTHEYTETHNTVPFLEGKSSVGRLGIDIHATAGKGDVGFCNYWTLEISVSLPVRVYAGMPIGQLIYFTVEGDVINPYKTKSSAKYNQRSPRPMESRRSASWSTSAGAVLVEHCDSFVSGREPAKGYLSLDAELDAVDGARAAGAPHVGVAINWGRSAIDGRSATTPTEHVRRTRERGLLAALMFSGAAAIETSYGAAWGDSHAPTDAVEPASLLTAAAIAGALAAAGEGLPILGLKVGESASYTAPSGKEISVEVTKVATYTG